MILHGYFRSSASWRVRIALALKNLKVEHKTHHLRRGDQHLPDYLAKNPQGLVPALQLNDHRVITQSLAIIEYLDETAPEPPLLPSDPFVRARVRAFAQVIASDIHPIQNLKILRRLSGLGIDDEGVRAWAGVTIIEGLEACERLLLDAPGPYCFGSKPTLADICLIPQLANARRFGIERRWDRLSSIDDYCRTQPPFQIAEASAQPDAE